ncbi:MAG TPA: hypothetical protein VM097_09890, partial [Mycobacteriales bacterium]|nr:hypothetical protein [Mycobacteriales bacterium]
MPLPPGATAAGATSVETRAPDSQAEDWDALVRPRGPDVPSLTGELDPTGQLTFPVFRELSRRVVEPFLGTTTVRPSADS